VTQSDPHPSSRGFLAKLNARLNRGRAWLQHDLRGLLAGRLDAATVEELEARLLGADVGINATAALLAALDGRHRERPAAALADAMVALLQPAEQPFELAAALPAVVLVVGVNGTGKTTTIGKLTQRLRDAGKSVLLAAGDTLRAAAVEQLKVWGARTGAGVIAQERGADPAAVVHDALTAAKARGVDALIIDTAGRMHTAGGLMDELKKVKRVIQRFDPTAPHHTLLVLDATQGQNALRQAAQFHQAVGVTGLVITKLDGTAKGGIVLAIARELALPIHFIGLGEGVEDLEGFRARAFAHALLGTDA
jgi:fused signal recognition particle receptor